MFYGNHASVSRVSIPWRAALLMMFAMSIFMAGCSVNPISEAETAEQRAFAVYGIYVASAETAADIFQDPEIPQGVRDDVRELANRSRPLVEGMYEAAQLAREAREDFRSGGETTGIRVNATITNLETWIAQAQPIVDRFKRSVDEARE